MFIAELTIPLAPGTDADRVADQMAALFGSLRQNGQIIGREFPIAENADSLRAFIMIPEPEALEAVHNNKYVTKGYAVLREAAQVTPTWSIIGQDPSSAESDDCERRASFILFTDYATLESPLLCGDCFVPLPIYSIPPTYDNSGYYDIMCWQTDYQACDRLQMNCRTGERFATRQMSDPNSSLSREGRDICARIEASTGTPTYYYLYRYLKATTRAKEEARRCPSCGGGWRLDERQYRIDFRCEPCRLVSSMSPGV